MAGGKKHGKRPRKTSDPQHKSPTQSQILKRSLREKGRDLTQSYDKSPYTNRNVKRAK